MEKDISKTTKAVTAAGLACLALIAASRLGTFRHEPDPVPAPAPPAIEVRIGNAGDAGTCVARYYPVERFPDRESVPVEDGLSLDGEAYAFYGVTDGLVSTPEGDCWKVLYSLETDNDTMKGG